MGFPNVVNRLLPVLRGVSSPSHAWRASAIDPDKAVIRQRFVPFLHALVAIDMPDRLIYVTRGHLEEWGVSGQEVFDAARANLPPTEGLIRRADDGLWQLRSQDGYEASRLLLPRWLAAFEGQVEGQPIAVAPHARYLVVGGEADLGKLLECGRLGWSEAGRPISPAPYTVREDGRVVPYLPEQDHPLRTEVENAHKLLLHAEYEQQRELLTELQPDTRLARVGLLESKGRMLSVASWTQGAPTLLPLTELVVLHPREGDPVWVSRPALDAAAGDCLEQLEGLEPPRYRTVRWPDTIEMERLKESALTVKTA